MVVSKSEDRIQGDFHTAIWNRHPKLRGLCFHPANGGQRSKIEGVRFKALGVVAGVPDYFVMVPAKGYGALVIEFKDDKGRSSDKQKEVQAKLREAGYLVYSDIRDTDIAIRLVEEYLEGTHWLGW